MKQVIGQQWRCVWSVCDVQLYIIWGAFCCSNLKCCCCCKLLHIPPSSAIINTECYNTTVNLDASHSSPWLPQSFKSWRHWFDSYLLNLSLSGMVPESSCKMAEEGALPTAAGHAWYRARRWLRNAYSPTTRRILTGESPRVPRGRHHSATGARWGRHAPHLQEPAKSAARIWHAQAGFRAGGRGRCW